MSDAKQIVQSLSGEFQAFFFQKLEKDEQIRVHSEWSFSEYTRYARDWARNDICDFGNKCYELGVRAAKLDVDIDNGLKNLQRLLSMRYSVGVSDGRWSLYDESEDCIHSAEGYKQFLAHLAELDNSDFIDIWTQQAERRKSLTKGYHNGT